jgi:hypothetical protein
MHATVHQLATPGDFYREFIAALVQAQLPAITGYLCTIK